MDSNRYGEQSHTPFRSRRLYSVNGQWYFTTREGIQFGPYQNQNEAAKVLAVFVAQNYRGVNANRQGISGLHPGAQDGIEYMVEELLRFFNFRIKHGQRATLVWANRRLKELEKNKLYSCNSKERVDALKYAMDQE